MTPPRPPSSLPPLWAMLTWLQGQPLDRVIGTPRASAGCAVHTWLSTVVQGPVDVDETTIVFFIAGIPAMVRTPDDYREVLLRLDNLGGYESITTVQEAREVLRDVLAEYREVP